MKATWFTGITPMATFRLAPGEYCEVLGHGIAIGAGEYPDEHSTGAVGAIIEAKEGETVTLSHSVDAGTGGWTQPDDLWLATIAGRVANEAPMPASAADREQLITRVTLDIFGVAPTAEEIAAFTVDNTPDALAKLTARLQTQPRIEPFAGKLPTGETKFRVIAADPNAAQAPRPATAQHQPDEQVVDVQTVAAEHAPRAGGARRGQQFQAMRGEVVVPHVASVGPGDGGQRRWPTTATGVTTSCGTTRMARSRSGP